MDKSVVSSATRVPPYLQVESRCLLASVSSSTSQCAPSSGTLTVNWASSPGAASALIICITVRPLLAEGIVLCRGARADIGSCLLFDQQSSFLPEELQCLRCNILPLARHCARATLNRCLVCQCPGHDTGTVHQYGTVPFAICHLLFALHHSLFTIPLFPITFLIVRCLIGRVGSSLLPFLRHFVTYFDLHQCRPLLPGASLASLPSSSGATLPVASCVFV